MTGTVLLNPGQDARYLGCLNECFGSWGDQRQYDWVFSRSAGSHATEQLVLAAGDDWMAGSGVSFRCVRVGGGDLVHVGIMTGSWTRPQFRGRGLFGRLIDASRDRCRTQGAAALLAFVTDENPSARALKRHHAVPIPAGYFVREPRPSGSSGNTLEVPVSRDVYASFCQVSPEGCFFEYGSLEAWAGQYVKRPVSVDPLRVGQQLAVVERGTDTDRVLWCAPTDPAAGAGGIWRTLIASADASERKLFTYATRALEGYDALSFHRKSGSLMVLVLDESHRAALTGPWTVFAGDRM